MSSHSQVTVLLPSGQNMNAANLHVLSNVAEAPQAILEAVSQVRTLCDNIKRHEGQI